MKTITPNILNQNIITGLLAAMTILSFDSCAKRIAFLTSSIVPAARGYVKIKRDNNHNYVIQIHLSDLAEVTRLQPPRQTYVVWMTTDDDITKNIAQINNSTNFLSEKFITSFETVSSFRPTKIFITAEYNGHVQVPDTMVILSTGSF